MTVKRVIIVALVMLVIIHFFLAIKVTQQPDYQEFYDTVEYFDLAETFLASGKYTGTEFLNSDLARPPGYPAFLLLGAVAFSRHWEYLIYLQVVFYCVTTWLIFLMGKRLVGENAGLLGAFLYLINPNATLWSMALLTEMLSTLLLVLAIWLFFLFLSSHRLQWGLFSGAALGLSCMVRPIMLPLIPIWAAVILFMSSGRYPNRRIKWYALMGFLVCSSALVLAWSFRNWAVHQEFAFTSVGNSTFENWMVAKTVARIENISRSDATNLIASQPDPMAYSLQFIRDHPGVFTKEQLQGILRTLMGSDYNTWSLLWTSYDIQTTGVLSQLLWGNGLRGIWASITSEDVSPWLWEGFYALLFDAAMYVLFIIGAYKALFKSRSITMKQLTLVILFTIAYLVITPGAAGESRFRTPADPLLVVIASFSLMKSARIEKQ
jgi:4-amino-4-deoxy-L-arabinose transferase-like glycosyltransferase